VTRELIDGVAILSFSRAERHTVGLGTAHAAVGPSPRPITSTTGLASRAHSAPTATSVNLRIKGRFAAS